MMGRMGEEEREIEEEKEGIRGEGESVEEGEGLTRERGKEKGWQGRERE